MNHGVGNAIDRFGAGGLEHVAGFVHGMRHEQQAGKARGHQQRPRRIAIRRIADFPRLVEFQRSARAGGLKLIIVGRVLAVDGVAAAVQYELRNGFLARQVGKLVEIFLNIFSRADQGVERGEASAA